jgi:hypothetical protein
MGVASSMNPWSIWTNDLPPHFGPLLILNFYVKLLKQQNPSDQAGFSIFLGKKILQCCVIRIDDDFRSNK